MKRDFLSVDDLSPEELLGIIKLAVHLKKIRKTSLDIHPLAGRSMAMLFEKPSLRTRVTFDLAMIELGGHAFMGQPSGIRLGQRESVPDVARNLERWVDLLVARVYENRTIRELAGNMRVPVINALCNLEHPCQAVADLMTVFEISGGRFPRVRLAFIGDGNNVCHSLMLICSALGVSLSVAVPRGYEPRAEYSARALARCKAAGAVLEFFNDPLQAVAGADFIYTDVWASMGQEAEQQKRRQDFSSFQVNAGLLRAAAADCRVLHCLPAHRGEEITDEVLDGPHSRVFDQAENRLHAQKALILSLLAPEVAVSLLESL
jgi:ornithine carbamoyltransferase